MRYRFYKIAALLELYCREDVSQLSQISFFFGTLIFVLNLYRQKIYDFIFPILWKKIDE
jgi:hypothetical protein